MAKRAEKLSERIIEWRRRIHSNPELSFQEHQTSNMVAEILGAIPGMNVEVGIGYPTSVVGTLSNGIGPSTAIRAYMDALLITAKHLVECLFSTLHKP